jgi:uncharacterized coiled-coil DUF342 family protein
MNQCNEPDHGAINAERAESRGLRKAWVELDDKRQDLEKQLSTITEQRDMLAEAALAVVDRWKSLYWDEVGQYHYINALRKAVEEVKGGPQ